jgi:hypothetical protein
VYVTVAEPPATPYITPVDGSTVAMAASLLLHVPPAVASVQVVVRPWHIAVLPPAIAAGVVFVTVILALLLQAPAVPVTVYVVVIVGLALTVAPAVELKPVAGDQVNDAPAPPSEAVMLNALPEAQ